MICLTNSILKINFIFELSQPNDDPTPPSQFEGVIKLLLANVNNDEIKSTRIQYMNISIIKFMNL